MTSDSPKHSVSVAGVIVDDEQRALIVRRRDNGEWQIPGGVLEVDEDVYAGLRREVYEETGLRVEPLRLSGVYKNMTLGVVALTFLCRSVDGTLTTSDETSEWAWIASAQVGQHMEEAFAIRVLDALESPVSIRSGPRTVTACLARPRVGCHWAAWLIQQARPSNVRGVKLAGPDPGKIGPGTARWDGAAGEWGRPTGVLANGESHEGPSAMDRLHATPTTVAVDVSSDRVADLHGSPTSFRSTLLGMLAVACDGPSGSSD